ncbi:MULTISPECIES: hypothetical protein [Streptomyces]|uniref:Uncharacterized protein n=1 Tax=Streptomyces viridochromogenes TaxID=1938 RepID=A0A0L8J016_STRVR|nr:MULTISPECIES: hypothetical protein [Streptomyces]KOG07015.1 hypothetical protein ADK34_41040 [Streptomyces viridochromogenes]
MARQLARGMGSFFKECGCVKPTRCPHPYSIRFRDALGKQREESGFGTQDEAIERYAEKHGTTTDGYLLRGSGGYFTEGMERRRVKKLFTDLSPSCRQLVRMWSGSWSAQRGP